MKSLNSLIVAALLTLSSHSATAAENVLQGSWRFTRQECASGAPFAPSLLFALHWDNSVVFSEDEMRFVLTMSTRLGEDEVRAKLSELLAELKRVQSLPDDAEKFKALKELNDRMASVESELNGFACTLTSVDKYEVRADTLHVGPNVSLVSNCPGTEHAGPEGYDAKIEMMGETFKLTDAKAESSDGGSCPKGDHTVTVFERVPVTPSRAAL